MMINRIDRGGGVHLPGTLSPEVMALVLRMGLGLVILSGGLNKLLRALDPERSEAFVATYMSAGGYVNTFFATYLLEGSLGSVLTPWSFLTALSAFEFVCGVLLVAGILVRPLALAWALLFWTFVLGLPVVTAAGYEITEPTHESPALLVLIRDVGLSGLFLVLYNIGSGAYSLDRRLLILNVGTRVGAGLVLAILLWYLVVVFDPGRPLIADMNAYKRAFALLAGTVILLLAGGGGRFSILRIRSGWARMLRPERARAPG